ncbi:MAG: hypothetical protein AAF664_09640 [Planctomycetota bacterium]
MPKLKIRTRNIIFLIPLLVSLVCNSPLLAQDVGSPSSSGTLSSDLQTLPPAAIPDATGTGAPGGIFNPTNWKLPQFKLPSLANLLPQKSEKERVIRKKDGLVSEVRSTAGNTWKRTREALDPAKLNPARFFTASNRQQSDRKPESSKPNFFKALFAPPEPEAPRISTPAEFLKQERIQP